MTFIHIALWQKVFPTVTGDSMKASYKRFSTTNLASLVNLEKFWIFLVETYVKKPIEVAAFKVAYEESVH